MEHGEKIFCPPSRVGAQNSLGAAECKDAKDVKEERREANCEKEALLMSGKIASMYAITEKVIYSGLASKIYLGVDRSSGLQAGIKVMLKRNMGSEEERRRALVEIELHSNVPAHPNVVRLLAAQETPDAFILATTYCPQGDLWALTKFGKTYCEAQVRHCAAQMFAGLHHIHQLCNIVHGDIKPHNFLLFDVKAWWRHSLCRPPRNERLVRARNCMGTRSWFPC